MKTRRKAPDAWHSAHEHPEMLRPGEFHDSLSLRGLEAAPAESPEFEGGEMGIREVKPNLPGSVSVMDTLPSEKISER